MQKMRKPETCHTPMISDVPMAHLAGHQVFFQEMQPRGA